MLMLSRRISEDGTEAINVYVRYDRNIALCNMLREIGIDPSRLSLLNDTITVYPLRIDNPTGCEEEIVIGIDAARHIDIVRSEIDSRIR